VFEVTLRLALVSTSSAVLASRELYELTGRSTARSGPYRGFCAAAARFSVRRGWSGDVEVTRTPCLRVDVYVVDWRPESFDWLQQNGRLRVAGVVVCL
jgi:hypothetical protein